MNLEQLAAYARQHDPAHAIVQGGHVVLFLPFTKSTPEGFRAVGVDVVKCKTLREVRAQLGY